MMGNVLVLAAAFGSVGAPSGSDGTLSAAKPSADETASARSERVRDAWVLSLEAVTRVPIDAGAQLGVETPFGLRVFAGYGWVPYMSMVAGIALNASDRDVATALLHRGHASGDSARFVLGMRPFRRIGLTIDGTVARLRLDANLAVAPLSFQGFESSGGSYDGHTSLDLWGVELGYQAELKRRVVLGAAAGVTGAMRSRTSITPSGDVPDDPALPVAAERVDHAFRTHVIPTVTLRLGFDAL